MLKKGIISTKNSNSGLFIIAAIFTIFWFTFGSIIIFFTGFYKDTDYFLMSYGGYIVISFILSLIFDLSNKRGLLQNLKSFIFAGLAYHFFILILMVILKITG